MIAIKVNRVAAIARLTAVQAASASAADINAVAARAVLNLCKAHLVRKNTSGSHKFWGEAAESARAETSAAISKVVIPRQGMHWQRFGGTHVAKPGGAIAIPLRDEDSGVWPSEKFGPKGADDNVFVYRRPSSNKAFLGRNEGGALRLYYILVKSVSKGPDVSVLPVHAQIRDAALRATASFIRRRNGSAARNR